MSEIKYGTQLLCTDGGMTMLTTGRKYIVTRVERGPDGTVARVALMGKGGHYYSIKRFEPVLNGIKDFFFS